MSRWVRPFVVSTAPIVCILRNVLTAIRSVEVLVPEALVTAAERLALDTPEDCDWQSWVLPAARLEGLAFLALMWRSDASYSAFKKLLGVVGLFVLLSPHLRGLQGSHRVHRRIDARVETVGVPGQYRLLWVLSGWDC